MSEAVYKSLSTKLEGVTGLSTDYVRVVTSLWDRWFDTMGMRTGTSPEALYESVEIDISHVDDLASRLGRDIDIPASLKDKTTALPLLSNKEKIALIQDSFAKADSSQIEAQTQLQEWSRDTAVIDEKGQLSVVYHGSFADLDSFSDEHTSSHNRLGKGFFFTSSPDDAHINYADPDSPELQAKAQAIQVMLNKQGIPFQSINYKAIKENLQGSGGVVYPVYLKISNAFEISEDAPYHLGQYHKAISQGAIITAVVFDHKGTADQAINLVQQLTGAVTTLDAMQIITDFTEKNELNGLPLNIIQRNGNDGVIDKTAGNLWHTPDGTTHYIAFKPEQIKSAIGNNGSYSPESSNILYQTPPEYSSVLFQYAGINAKGADTGMLSTAKRLEDAGENPERIRRLTGWHKWVDDKWRFEIDDSQSMINSSSFSETTDLYDRLAQNKQGAAAQFMDLSHAEQETIRDTYAPSLHTTSKLEDVLQHPTLFAHYPELKQIKVTLDIWPDLTQTRGGLYRTASPMEIFIRSPNGAQLFNAILHETQHAIQEIEQFSRGRAANDYDPLSSEAQVFYQRQLNNIKLLLDMANLHNIDLEESARRLGSTLAEPTRMMARTHNRQQIENYSKQLSFKLRPSQTRYYMLAGEYESRDVEHRKNLSLRQRLATPPYSSENQPSGLLEVVMPGQGNEDAIAEYSSAALGAVLRNPDSGKFLILLTEDHNVSTLIHEGGHVFLDIFTREALKETAPECIKDDYNVLCQHLGVTPGLPFSEEQHEQWARTVEAYFLNKDSGLLEPNSAFERMSDWMKDIYQDAQDLGVSVDSEVRGVLDRMFDFNTAGHDIDYSGISEIIDSALTPASKEFHID